ncbi:histidine--tRNA ligase [Membranihabitans maritimus]|uniref:histidine--tRNA ligase n=1 Tax=Membranihabitans maritimus TaxID=2904244 RepID=UPI001F01FF06|nr:histidine--tRNA ligase [Membranihabitans maritimus]
MKVNIPKGTRDFGPQEIYKRKYIFNTIKKYFELFGYVPIETPAMENLDTLTGKYGEEGDQLLFKVLNNGDFLKKVSPDILEEKNSPKAVKQLSKRGLKYDLTIPFARYVVMHRNEINIPFKRYQIQPVWRADRPQKGRYQEFYQCDADVIGSSSLQYEAEFVQLFDKVFRDLGISVDIKINNRKLLTALSILINEEENLTSITTAIDKLDKIGESGVVNILKKLKLPDAKITSILKFLSFRNLSDVREFFNDIELGQLGVKELEEIYSFLTNQQLTNTLTFDPTLARGLNYYTGTIFEVAAKNVEMGSIGGGGRYDDLTKVFGGEALGGIGISFGAERIFDVMEELKLFPPKIKSAPVLILTLDPIYQQHGYTILNTLRDEGIKADLYPAGDKMKKQMKYANNINCQFVIIIGEEEFRNQNASLKNMITGEQVTIDRDEIVEKLLKPENH